MAVVAGNLAAGRGNRIFGLAATYIGTVVGAGFASGQEIWTFFSCCGLFGFAGLCLSGLLFAVAGVKAMDLGSKVRPGETYYQTLQALFGAWAPLLDLILLFFLLILSGVMLAGMGALAGVFHLSSWIGIVFSALLGLMVIALDLQGLILVNKIVVPCLIVLSGLVTLWNLRPIPSLPSGVHVLGIVPSALLYASYNIVLSLPVLTALGQAEQDRSIRLSGSIWGASGLSLIGSLILAAMFGHYRIATTAEVPMAEIAMGMGPLIWFGFSLILWAEMFSTLIADVYGVAVRFKQIFNGSRLIWAVLAMTGGGLLSSMGFARLIKIAYPAFGLICLVVLVRLLWPKI